MLITVTLRSRNDSELIIQWEVLIDSLKTKVVDEMVSSIGAI